MSATRKCATQGCHCILTAEPGLYYCDVCVAEQLAENAGMSEREAFDAYHAWIDRLSMAEKMRAAADNLSTEPCSCWDFGQGDEWPHFKDANGRCTPYSRRAQEHPGR